MDAVFFSRRLLCTASARFESSTVPCHLPVLYSLSRIPDPPFPIPCTLYPRCTIPCPWSLVPYPRSPLPYRLYPISGALFHVPGPLRLVPRSLPAVPVPYPRPPTPVSCTLSSSIPGDLFSVRYPRSPDPGPLSPAPRHSRSPAAK